MNTKKPHPTINACKGHFFSHAWTNKPLMYKFYESKVPHVGFIKSLIEEAAADEDDLREKLIWEKALKGEQT
jgi:hypothetical protein